MVTWSHGLFPTPADHQYFTQLQRQTEVETGLNTSYRDEGGAGGETGGVQVEELR